jgi:hypothetical protein
VYFTSPLFHTPVPNTGPKIPSYPTFQAIKATNPPATTVNPNAIDRSLFLPPALAFVVAALLAAEVVPLAPLEVVLALVVEAPVVVEAAVVVEAPVVVDAAVVAAPVLIVSKTPPCKEAGAEALATLWAALMYISIVSPEGALTTPDMPDWQ